MKTSALLILMAFGLIMTVSLHAQENVTSMDRAKRIMAIRAAAKRVIDDSKDFLDAPQTRATIREKMTSFMKADIPAQKNRNASRKLCLGYARQSIQDILVSNVVLAVADASRHSPLPITVNNVLANVDSNWTGSTEQVAAGFTERHFDRVFTEARENVTASQRLEVEKKVSYPPYPTLNKELTSRAGSKTQLTRAEFDAIGKWWSNKDSQKFNPLYDEVQKALDATVYKSMGNEIAVQYENQRSIFQKKLSNKKDLVRYLTSDGIHDRIVSLCLTEIQKAAPKSSDGLSAPVYKLFDVTDADIRKTALKMETEYFLDYVRSLSSLPITNRDLNRVILSDLPAHKNARQSNILLNRKFADKLSGWAASSYVMRPGTDSSVRNNSSVRHFSSLLSETNAAASAWTECVKKSLDAPLKTAREDIARQQIDKYFSRLNSAEILPDPVLNVLAEKRNFAPFKSTTELRKFLPELMPPAKDSEIFLEETEVLALDKANKLNSSAGQAAREQELCLRKMEKDKMAQLEADVAARKPFAKIIFEWSNDLAKRWLLQAQKINSPYQALLGRTSDLLNKTVRQLYDSKLVTAKRKSVQQDSSKPTTLVKREEKIKIPQSDSGSGVAEKAKTTRKTRGDTSADLFIVIRDVGQNKCEALLETIDGSVLAKINFDPDKVNTADEKIFSSFRDEIRGLIASKQTVRRGALFGLLPDRRSGLKDLGVFIVTQSVRVRLKTSLLIRKKIEKLIEQWAQEASGSAPKLRWGTGLSSDGLEKLGK